MLVNNLNFKVNPIVDKLLTLKNNTLTDDVVKSWAIEGESLNPQEVRSSIARRLGIDLAGLIPANRDTEGFVEMMLDATQQFKKPLTQDRLFNWHAALFPTGRSGMQRIIVGGWRTQHSGPMQVVSGPVGKEKIHFEAKGNKVIGPIPIEPNHDHYKGIIFRFTILRAFCSTMGFSDIDQVLPVPEYH